MQIRAIDSFAGQTLGKYHVERLLGRGRLSVVYLARDVTSQRIEALAFYFVPDHFPPEARNRFLARFLKEAAAVSLLRHPHILSISGYGESGGNPYLVTPYLTNGSLANVLRQRGRLPHPEVLAVLEQVAAALEYAHSKGLVHGALKPANIVLSSKHTLLVSGFGLMRMLQMKGIVGSNQPEAHLLNVAGTPLAALEYVSPEMVQGLKVDSRADVYSLGAISFELLCGKPPFSGADPLDVARQRLSRPVPSLRALYPDIPIALESVINQALEHDPQRRFQHVSELVEAFRQVSQGASGAPGAREHLNLGIYDGESPVHTDELPLSATFPGPASTRQLQDTPADGYPATNWQLVPPIVSGKLPAITPSQDEQRQPATTREHTPGEENWQLIPPVITGGLPSVRVSIPSQSLAKKGAKPAAPPQPAQTPHSERSKRSAPPAPQDMPPVQAQAPQARSVQKEDSPVSSSMQTVAQAVSEPAHEASGAGTMRPFDWWSMPGPTDASIYGRPAEAAPVRTAQPADASAVSRGTQHLNKTGTWDFEPARPLAGVSRRSGSKAKKSTARRTGRRRVVAMLAGAGALAAGAAIVLNLTHVLGGPGTQAMNGTVPGGTTAGGQQNTTKGNTAAGGKQQMAQNSILGSANMAKNSSLPFTNPADGKQSLLVRLPNGNYVAYERACTHENVNVNYDPGSHLLVCPAHGAIFDPANGGKVIQGPATRPVASVKLRVNADGSISTV